MCASARETTAAGCLWTRARTTAAAGATCAIAATGPRFAATGSNSGRFSLLGRLPPGLRARKPGGKRPKRLNLPLFEPVAANLGPVAAIAHVAPAAAVVLARVHKQPAAVVSLALAHMLHGFTAGQQLRRRTGDWAEGAIERPVVAGPLPGKSSALRYDAHPAQSAPQLGIQLGQVGIRRPFARYYRQANLVNGFAQPKRAGGERGGVRWATRGLSRQSSGLGFVQQTCLLCPGDEGSIRIQVFARGDAPFSADGVGEVQTEFPSD